MEQTFCEEDSEVKEVENLFYDMSTLGENCGTDVSISHHIYLRINMDKLQ